MHNSISLTSIDPDIVRIFKWMIEMGSRVVTQQIEDQLKQKANAVMDEEKFAELELLLSKLVNENDSSYDIIFVRRKYIS